MKRGDAGRDLHRLRSENNRLKRRLQEIETRLSNELGRRTADVEALRGELAGIKASRVWRFALRLRALQDRITPGPAPAGTSTSDARDRRAMQYRRYLDAHALTPERVEGLRLRARDLPRKPLISVIMPVYNTQAGALREAVDSVLHQIYDAWELCIVNDASNAAETLRVLSDIQHPGANVVHLERNRGIADATNEGIRRAQGEYLAFMDHDDQLAADALLEVADAINATGADLIYTDEDNLDVGGERVNPHFKPDFSPDLLLSYNYITHLLVVRRGLAEELGGLRGDFDGAQDYDFVLRAAEKAAAVRHIPKVLYHWRMSAASTSFSAESKPRAAERGREALNEALRRRGTSGEALMNDVGPHFYRVRYEIRDEPLVSIVIPFKDRADLLHCIVGDILELSTYANFRILGISNNSTEQETFDAMRDLAGMDERVRFHEHDRPFSYSGLVNHGARLSSGTHVVLVNNDIRIKSAGWIEAMLEHSQRAEVGAVGGKLYYPDGRIQHAGVIVGIDGYAGHSHKGFPGEHNGYFNRLRVVQNVSAVTGAFMMVKKELYGSVGGFDEQDFGIACNDVDFCLRLREKGFWNVFTPYAEAWHLESASRGYEDTPEKQRRFAGEKALFAERHREILEGGDPFYNPNLTAAAEDFSIRTADGAQ